MQEFSVLQPTGYIDEDREKINNNFAAIISDFSDTAFPTNNRIAGMWCDRTDQKKIYRLASDLVNWQLVFDYSDGAFTVPRASYSEGANKALTDNLGQEIAPTYIKSIKNAGSVLTVVRGDGKSEELTLPDTKYDVMTGASMTLTGKAGLVPAPVAGQNNRYLRSDGLWVEPPNDNTTYSAFKGATSNAAGAQGLVPTPAAGANGKFLRGDGNFRDIFTEASAYFSGSTQPTRSVGSIYVNSYNGNDSEYTTGSGNITNTIIRLYANPAFGAGTYSLKNAIQTCINSAHRHTVTKENAKSNCNCNCNCDCGDDCGP